jgi:4-hydroxyacetophenone monooxygenase
MRLNPSAEPIDGDDAEIRAALDDADVPALLTAVAQITGDLSILRDDVRPDPTRMLEPDAGYTPEQLSTARDRAAAALARYRDGGSVPAPAPDGATLHALLAFLAGGSVEDDYVPLLTEELALDGEDFRRPTWTKDEIAPDTPFTVAIVGAGMSGIAAAHRLSQVGVPYVIFEKNADVGGTWFENVYPGCRVDVPNHLYSYSFAQTGEWPEFFSSQDVLLDYFRSCADQYGVREHVRFGTEVLSADFRDGDETWVVRVRGADGAEESHEVQALVSAVGQLNRPSFPAIAGRDRFAGDSFHSAQWDDDIDLDGRRVAVIGTGASAAQFIPVVAERAAELTIYQRTPPWLIPTPNYTDELPDGLRWLLRHVPAFARWDRLWWFWRTHEGLLPMAVVDPDWQPQDRSVSAANDMVRELFTAYLQMEFPDAELFRKVLPAYPPIAKRVVRDNGIWARTLTRDNVELVTDPIAEITEKGVRTADGMEREAEVLIYGTGFQASRFLTPVKVRGRGGLDLHEWWDGEARAYLGLTVPGFPNLFLMYGPNTNIVINGSIIYFSECEAHYIVESVRMLLEAGARSMDCRRDVHDRYNERIDAANRAMAWGASTVSSWYKNESGRVAQNWPFSLLEFWQQTRDPDPSDYEFR